MANPKTEETSPSNADVRAQWESEKIAFGRQALAEARIFLELDNSIVRSLATITASVAAYVEAHPDRVFAVSKTASGGLGVALDHQDIAGGDFGSDLFDLIKEILLKDKDFIIKIIEAIFGL